MGNAEGIYYVGYMAEQKLTQIKVDFIKNYERAAEMDCTEA